ncbi:hypothetical protein PVAP13_2NG301112 [Panicum virgatum]|uniref:Wall-associated receptor kinase galacturonan-binding domain-containing protein n=1 Tax=Panicum virgatum TaxID=38727 RepID=A0A8T0VIQ9_PANVG|nr:hypothetical protein PVAP13_2NG301112 [Panicum virgatum]
MPNQVRRRRRPLPVRHRRRLLPQQGLRDLLRQQRHHGGSPLRHAPHDPGDEPVGGAAAEAKVMLPVAYRCHNSTGGTVGLFDGHVDVNTHGVYRISDARNAFVVLGCNTGAYTSNSATNGTGRYNYQFYMGCFTYCGGPGSAMDGRCASVGCCRVDIAPGLTDNVVSFEDWPHDGMDYSPCDIAFLVDKDSYDFRASDLRMDVERTSMPVWLDWAIRDESAALTCAAARNSARYACVSANSECVDSANVPGYFCRCKQGFEGNPYEDNGCTSKYRQLGI